MLTLVLTNKNTTRGPSRMLSLYADPDSWFLAMALFESPGTGQLAYMDMKNLIVDWDLLECRKVKGAEAGPRRTIPASLLDLHELISSSIVLNDISIGTVRDAVIDENNMHIDAFLVDYIENESSRILFLESKWCSWSRGPESHLLMRVPFEEVRKIVD